jgi:DNA mismatch endonuclease, patch repair protein
MQYWKPKLDNNKIRDKENIKTLRKSGWKVIVIWECWLKNMDKVEARIIKFMDS